MEIELDTSYDDDVGLGAEDKKHARSNQLEWFKGEKNRIYRVSLVYFNPLKDAVARAVKKKNPAATKEEIIAAIQSVYTKKAESLSKSVDQLTEGDKLDLNNVRFKKIEAHYKEGVGYVVSRLGKDGSEADSVWKTLGDLKTYFTTCLVVYPTTLNGEVIKDQLTTNWTVIPWRFSNKVFRRLHDVADSLRSNELNICMQDLTLKCTNSDFQNFDIDGAGKALWRMNEKFSAKVLEQACPIYEKLQPFRELSTADLKLKLGITDGGGTDTSMDGGDFGSLIDQV
jgi:hypothetical protein